MMTRKKHKNLEQAEPGTTTDENSADGGGAEQEQDMTLVEDKGRTVVNATRSMDTTPSPQVRGSGTSIRSTPVTRRRSSSFKINRTLNVTNLNILFDSSHINQGFSPRDRMNNCRTSQEPPYETPKGWSKKPLARTTTTPNININPYVKDSAIKKYTKHSNKSLEKSLGELSFFAPNLYNWKSASTPIIHNRHTATATDLRNSPIFNSNDLGKHDRNHSNNTTIRKPLEELDADLFVDKKNNVAGYGGIAGEQRQQQQQRGYEYVVDKIKKCGESSLKWSWVLIDFLRKQVGTALWNPDHNSTSSSCDCSNHLRQKTEVDELSSKVDELTRELGKIKTEMECQKSNANRMVNISTEMTEIRTGLVKIDEIFKQLEFLKGHLMTNSSTAHHGFAASGLAEVTATPPQPPPAPAAIPPPPVVAAPPPPPPPPPMPDLAATPAMPLVFLRKSSKNKEGKKSGKENMRPIISLDDILKVKLKKTAERPGPVRRSSQPVISQDMLKQVKLKPPSLRCSGTPVLLHSQSLDVSPRTSLNRILSCDNPSVHKTESSTETDGPPPGEDLTVDPDDDDDDDNDGDDDVSVTILERYSTLSVENHGKSRDHHHHRHHGKKSKKSNSVTRLKEKIEENCLSNT